MLHSDLGERAMTLPAHAQKFGGRLPSESEKATANHLRQILAAQANDGAKLSVLDENNKQLEITLSAGISSVLMDLLRHIGRGDAVTLVPVGQMLTTQQAADILNVSRPYLISLLEEKKIPHEMTGRHRRIKADDLFEYKENRDAMRAKALDQLAQDDSEFL
jgi:excisionase family DNA binding protein